MVGNNNVFDSTSDVDSQNELPILFKYELNFDIRKISGLTAYLNGSVSRHRMRQRWRCSSGLMNKNGDFAGRFSRHR